jgi:hypothetical protein
MNQIISGQFMKKKVSILKLKVHLTEKCSKL